MFLVVDLLHKLIMVLFQNIKNFYKILRYFFIYIKDKKLDLLSVNNKAAIDRCI